MVKFKTNGKNGSFEITLPTDLKELTPEYLKGVTADVEIAENYSLIAVCYREKLSTVIMSARQNKNLTTNVVPVFVKSNINFYNTETPAINNFMFNLQTGDKLIISGSQIALGHHVAAPKNRLSIPSFMYLIDGDVNAYKSALNHTEYVYFVEFKIIPNCDIIGAYKDIEESFENPFSVIDVSEQA